MNNLKAIASPGLYGISLFFSIKISGTSLVSMSSPLRLIFLIIIILLKPSMTYTFPLFLKSVNLRIPLTLDL